MRCHQASGPGSHLGRVNGAVMMKGGLRGDVIRPQALALTWGVSGADATIGLSAAW